MAYISVQEGGVSIIMPTLNEADNITDLIRLSVQATHDFGVRNIEILVVDDNSSDRTWDIASQVICPLANVRVIRRMSDHGLTASLREGIASVQNDIIIWMDCDFSHPPECIPQMLYMLNQGFDAVVNSRYVVGGGEERAGKGGPLQLFLSMVLNWSIRFLLQASFADYTSGFIAVRRPVLEQIPLRGDYGEYFVDFVFRALHKGYRICELPYNAKPRRSGLSKTGNNIFQYFRRGRKYLWTVFKLRIDVLSGRL